jgi:hypothetical protein
MSQPKDRTHSKPVKSEEDKLDDALAATFPASDPPSQTDPSVRVGQSRPSKAELERAH